MGGFGWEVEWLKGLTVDGGEEVARLRPADAGLRRGPLDSGQIEDLENQEKRNISSTIQPLDHSTPESTIQQRMYIFKATSTLEKILPTLDYTEDKAEADIILVGGKKFDLADFPKLKGIFKCGVGTDNLPFEEAEKRGIEIRLPSDATRDIIYEETASFAVYLLLRMCLAGAGDLETWKKEDRPSLQSRMVLILGTGNIGGKAAEKARSFFQVETYDPAQDAESKLEQLLPQADAVSLHMPLMDSTRHFFDKARLSQLQDGAILVNTARGPIIDEEALYDEIKAGRLKAALDVFSKEPYDGPLKEFHPDKGVYLTPHIASTCREFLEGLARDFLDFIEEIR
jgi:D-3-phosphoglycerate dehydrogenase